MTQARAWFPNWFPQQQQQEQEHPEEIFIENALQTMHFWGLTKKEFDELDIPEYIIMREYAFKKLTEEKEQMDKMMSKFNVRGKA